MYDKEKNSFELEKMFTWPSPFSYHKQYQASIDECIVFLPQNIFPVRYVLKILQMLFCTLMDFFLLQISTFPLSICVHFPTTSCLKILLMLMFVVFYEEACPL